MLRLTVDVATGLRDDRWLDGIDVNQQTTANDSRRAPAAAETTALQLVTGDAAYVC